MTTPHKAKAHGFFVSAVGGLAGFLFAVGSMTAVLILLIFAGVMLAALGEEL